MNGENDTIISWLVQWLEDWGILVSAATAIFASSGVVLCLRKYYSPKLDIEFKDKDPYCRHEKKEEDLGPYWCHFVVVNGGRRQADDCEAVLERIWDSGGEKENSKWPEWKKWIPVNLKWSVEERNSLRACFKTIYPGGRKYFCDIGRVNRPKDQAEDQEKFTFELARSFISQDTYLRPGTYKIQISLYSKNTAKYNKKRAKVTKKFVIDWRGGWAKTQPEMQKRLKMKML